METILLVVVVAGAFVVEAAAGFGATVLTVTIGALFLPIDQILAAMVPVNLLLSSLLVVRNRAAVRWRYLATGVLPLVGVGMAAGLWAFELRGAGWIKPAFAVFVIGLSVLQLRAMTRTTAPAEPPRAASMAALLGGGFIHGLFACGGPMVVYVMGRELPDKAGFRATLSALWLVLNGVLVAGYVRTGTLGETSLLRSAALLGSLAFGVVVGDRLHHRLDEKTFRWGVYVLLLVAASLLLLNSVRA